MQLLHVRYEPLCVVELQHEYYMYKKLLDFKIQPTATTEVLMRQHGILFKQVENKLYLLVQTEQLKPKRAFDKPLCWSFYVYITNDFFTNFTNIRLNSFRKNVYHFSNLNDNMQNETPFLTRKILVYQENIVYQLGDWVQTPDGKFWEAIHPQPNQAPQTDSEQWQLCVTTTPCATFQDRIALMNSRQALNEINEQPIFGLDPKSTLYNQTVNKYLGEYPAIYARPKEESAPWVYVDDKAWQSSPFAIVDIHHHPTLTSDYALFDDKGLLRSPNYVLRFANRSTLWRYFVHNKAADAIQDKAAKYKFAKISDHEFVSSRPIPLTQEPVRSLMLQIPAFGAVNPLPNPNIYQILPQDGRIYSNIHLNY